MIQERLERTGPEGGKRIHISAEDNALSFFDTTDKRVLYLDDDVAIDEGTYESNIPAYDVNSNPLWISSRMVSGSLLYTYPIKGPGIQVGYGINDPGGFSTIGRKKIFTTGTVEATDVISGQVKYIIDSDYSCGKKDSTVIVLVENTTRSVFLYTIPIEGKKLRIVMKQAGSHTGNLIIKGPVNSINDFAGNFQTQVTLTSPGFLDLVYTTGAWHAIGV